MKNATGGGTGARRSCFRLTTLLLAILALFLAGVGPAQATSPGPQVRVLLLPPGTDLSMLDSSEWARGLLSAGMGRVSLAQTMLDIGQGTRVAPGAYEEFLPDPESTPVGRFLQIAAERAESAPRPIEVGALRDALNRGGTRIRLPQDHLARIAFSSPKDPFRTRAGKADGPRFTAAFTNFAALGFWRDRLRPGDTLIAMEMPGGSATLDIAIAGDGFTGVLGSNTTHLPPLVSSVDLAPTILERLDLPVPNVMEGTRIVGGKSVAFGSIRDVEDRLRQVRDRRSDLMLWGSLTVALFFLVSVLVGRRDGLRFAISQTAVGLPLAVFLLLAMTRFRLESGIELPLVFALASTGAWILRRRLGELRAYAAACGLLVFTVIFDLVAGIGLIPYSVLGSNPIGGVRFFGVGNELEAIVAACLVMGVSAWGESRPELENRGLAAIFIAGGALVLLALVPGRFGADVGALVTVTAGVAAACLLLLRRSWKLIAAVVLAPVALIAIFALIDTVTGASSHFVRTVLGANSLGDAGDVLLSRLRKSAHTVVAISYRPYLLLVLAIGVGLALAARLIGDPLRGSRLAAGLYSAMAALLFGAAGNDSGVLLILAGAPFVLSFWAMGLMAGRETQAPATSGRG